MESIGGYRLVRMLGRGERADVFLGHAGDEGQSGHSLAAVKLLRAEVPASSVDAEIQALTASRSRHLVELTDISRAGDDRIALILTRLGGGSLAELLRRRERFDAGEAVTILAPICDAVLALHTSGHCHGGIAPASILFDDSGAPVLACLGRATSFETPAEARPQNSPTIAAMAAQPGVVHDVRTLVALAALVLGRTGAGADLGAAGTGEALRWLRSADAQRGAPECVAELRDRLFAMAQARPIRFGEAEPGARRPAVVQTRPVLDDLAAGRGADGDYRAPDEASATGVATWPRLVIAVARRLARRVPLLSARMVSTYTSLRRPVKIAAVGGLAAAVVAFALVPALGVQDSDAAHSGASPSRPSTAATHEQADPASGVASLAAPTSAETAPPAGAADDPVAAVAGLLRKRARCLDTFSLGCLASVDQGGSAALADDTSLVRALRDGKRAEPSIQLSGSTATLTQRLGDSALVALHLRGGKTIVPILIVDTPQGWRIRDFLPQ